MKSMAASYVQDIVHKSYSYSEGRLSPSPRTIHYLLATTLWMFGAVPPQTLIRTTYLFSVLKTLDIFGVEKFYFIFYFPMNLYFIDAFISNNFEFALSVTLSLQKLFKKWHGEFLSTLIPQTVILICRVCVIGKNDLLSFSDLFHDNWLMVNCIKTLTDNILNTKQSTNLNEGQLFRSF
jgi:hypothetical protein